MASAIVRFGKHIKEIRIHLCQTSDGSKGVRDFIEKHYVEIKSNNCKFPICIRECSNIQPKIYARYEFGREMSLPLANLDSSQVLHIMQSLATRKQPL